MLREHSRSLGQVPLIDHNPHRGEKIEVTPSEAQRYKERSQAEQMFGMPALTANQFLRLLT